MGTLFFGLFIPTGLFSWIQGEQVKGVLLVLLGVVSTALCAYQLITGHARIHVTSQAVRAFGVSLAWADVTWVQVQRAGGERR